MNSKTARRIYESTPKELKEKVRKEVNQKIMNELREKIEKYLVSISLDPAHLPKIFNDDDKSYYSIPELIESFIQSQPINKVVTDNTKVNTNALERIKELEKENEKLLKSFDEQRDLNFNLWNDITQLQKKINDFISLEAKYGMYRSLEEAYDVKTFLESLTNKTDEKKRVSD